MNEHVLSPDDLIRITGARRYSKQRRWFEHQFGIDVTCNSRGEIILTWVAYDALMLKKWGIEPARVRPEVELFFD